MDLLINLLTLTNFVLAILLVVVHMAQMDRAYAAQVRAEHERKSLLRGRDKDTRD